MNIKSLKTDFESDKFWNEHVNLLRKKMGYCPMTFEEAELEYQKAPKICISDDEVRKIVASIVDSK